eukprot:scaffold82750_cov19-Tisochrysis_lutea.AAC.1
MGLCPHLVWLMWRWLRIVQAGCQAARGCACWGGPQDCSRTEAGLQGGQGAAVRSRGNTGRLQS